MIQVHSQELHVSIDVGCYQHDVSVGLANGKFLGRFGIHHNKAGFADFFHVAVRTTIVFFTNLWVIRFHNFMTNLPRSHHNYFCISQFKI